MRVYAAIKDRTPTASFMMDRLEANSGFRSRFLAMRYLISVKVVRARKFAHQAVSTILAIDGMPLLLVKKLLIKTKKLYKN